MVGTQYAPGAYYGGPYTPDVYRIDGTYTGEDRWDNYLSDFFI